MCSRETLENLHRSKRTYNQLNTIKWSILRFKNCKSQFSTLLLINPNFEAITEKICSENKDDSNSDYECRLLVWW